MIDQDAIEATLQAVARKHYVTPERIVSREHNKYIIAARREAAKALYEKGLNGVQIGQVLNRHQTTVLNLLGRIGARSKGTINA